MRTYGLYLFATTLTFLLACPSFSEASDCSEIPFFSKHVHTGGALAITRCASTIPTCPQSKLKYTNSTEYSCTGADITTSIALPSCETDEGYGCICDNPSQPHLPGPSSCKEYNNSHGNPCELCYLIFNGSGIEYCGDGVDNNNNGKVDEGCGGRDGGVCVGKPIHITSGNMFLSRTDFVINTASSSIYFTRTYNSNHHLWKEHRLSRLGYGWRHNFQSNIILPKNSNDNLYKILLDGKALVFKKVVSNSNVIFEPEKGTDGYQLKENLASKTFELVSPDGNRFIYDVDNTQIDSPTSSFLQLTKIFSPNSTYLQLSYVRRDGISHGDGTFEGLKYLKTVLPKFADGSAGGKGIQLEYTPYNGNWRVKRIATHSNDSNITTCTSDSSCSSGDICIKTIPQTIIGSDTYGSDTQGLCGKKLLDLEYSGGQLGKAIYNSHPTLTFIPALAFKVAAHSSGFGHTGIGSHPTGNGKIEITGSSSPFGSFPNDYLNSFALLSKVSRSSTFFHTYSYDTNSSLFKTKLLEEKDSAGYVIEKHTYNQTNGRAETSESPDEKLTVDYSNYNSDPNVSGLDEIKVTRTYATGVKKTQIYIINKDNGELKSKSGPCDCDMSNNENSWVSQYGNILPEAIKENGRNAYTSFSYVWKDKKIWSKKIVVGDDDKVASGTNPPNALISTVYYHPKYSNLPIAIALPSSNPNHSKWVVYDYDVPTNIQGGTQCNPVESCTIVTGPNDSISNSNFNNNPGSKLYRIIVRGYTKTIDGSWVANAKNRVTKFEYDENTGSLIKIIGPRSERIEFEYYPSSENSINKRHMLRYIKAYNGTGFLITEFVDYNEFGIPSEVKGPSGSIKKFIFDSLGFLEQLQSDYRNNSTQLFSSYSSNQLLSRDPSGRINYIQKPNGSVINYIYGSTFGRLTSISFKESTGGSSRSLYHFSYNSAGQILKVIDMQARINNGVSLYSSQKEWKYEYDPSDNSKIVKIYNPLPNRGYKEFRYHPNGTIKSFQDENGQKTLYSYTIATRKWITRVTKYLGSSNTNPVHIDYEYDVFGRVKSVTDTKGIRTEYIYDDFDNVVEIKSPDRAPNSDVIRMEYDISGNLIKKKRADSVIVQYEYDILNRITKIDYPDYTGSNPYLTDNDVNFFYDESHSEFSVGRLTRTTVKMFKDNNVDVIRTVKYFYDAAGNIVEKRIDEGSNVWSTYFMYDKEGNRTEIKYPLSGKVFQYSYNSGGQLVDLLQDIGGPGIFTSVLQQNYYRSDGSFGAAGIPYQTKYMSSTGSISNVTRSLMDGAIVVENSNNSTASTYLASGSSLNHVLSGHAGLLSRQYMHDKTGLISSYSCLGGSGGCFPGNHTSNYSFDGIYRVSQVNVGSNHYIFSYDSNGNIIKSDKNSGSDVWEFEYGTINNRLQRRYRPGFYGSGQVYQQFTDGKRKEDANYNYIYHMNGRLAIMEPKPGVDARQVVFAYDHMGRRVRKMSFDVNSSSSSDITSYFFDLGSEVLEETKTDSDLFTYYRSWVWIGSKMYLGEYSKTPFFNLFGPQERTYQFYRYHHDHLGRPVVVTDSKGSPVWRSKAEPYGRDSGYNLKHNPYEEFNLTNNVVPQIHYSSGTVSPDVRAWVKPGTYAIQFYFKNLNLLNENEKLKVYIRSSSGDEEIHSFTGLRSFGEFWGPVINFKHKQAGASPGEIVFKVESSNGQLYSGSNYEISKYRLWYVPGGDVYELDVDDHSNGNSAPYPAQYSPGPTGIWTKTYNGLDSAKMMRVCFSSFYTEWHYDEVEIKNGLGKVIQTFSGSLGAFCSAWVQGKNVTIHFNPDSSVEKAGFVVDRIEQLTATEIKARLPGQWYEKETEVKDSNGDIIYAGLHYNWNRFYDSEVRRYITPDPIGLEGGMNVFQYAVGDPINHFDYMGLDATLYWFHSGHAHKITSSSSSNYWPHMVMRIDFKQKVAGKWVNKSEYRDFYPGKKNSWGVFGNVASTWGQGDYMKIELSDARSEELLKKIDTRRALCSSSKKAKSKKIPKGCRYGLFSYSCHHFVYDMLNSIDISSNFYDDRLKKYTNITRGKFKLTVSKMPSGYTGPVAGKLVTHSMNSRGFYDIWKLKYTNISKPVKCSNCSWP